MLKVNKYKIYNEDCIEGMSRLKDESVDCIICDLPYGTTVVEHDKKLPYDKMWNEYLRVCKKNAAIVLFANNMFEMELASSNLKMFKFKYTWIKNSKTNFIQCRHRPMTQHEDILVFSKGNAANGAKNNITYNPQGLVKNGKVYKQSKTKIGSIVGRRRCTENYNKPREYSGYPSDVLYYNVVSSKDTLVPAQKPLDLVEFLVKTYTNEGDLILDNCCGSGTTAIASVKNNRRFVGFEISEKFYKICMNRIEEINDD